MTDSAGLPRRIPTGTHYIVEGERGPDGEFKVTSRYLVMPNGRQRHLNATHRPGIATARLMTNARRSRNSKKSWC
jgi:hypothetical protein